MADDAYFPNLAKIKIRYIFGRLYAENILWAFGLGIEGASGTELTTAATTLTTSLTTHVMPLLSSQVVLDQVSVADWSNAEGLTGFVDSDVAGGDTSEVLPAQTAILINYQATLRYRGGHCRTYLPPPGGGALESVLVWSDAFVVSMQAAWADFGSAIDGLNIGGESTTLVLYHRGTAKVPQGVENIVTFEVQDGTATIRRRARRAGHIR